MRSWDSNEAEVPPKEEKPDPVGFLKYILLGLGILVVFGKPFRALWASLAGRFSRK